MPSKGFNPFYALLVLVGIVFSVTACAYGVMMVRKIRHPQDPNPHPLIEALDEHGFAVLMTELGVMAATTFAAMATDSHWIRRAAKAADSSTELPTSSAPSEELPATEEPPPGDSP